MTQRIIYLHVYYVSTCIGMYPSHTRPLILKTIRESYVDYNRQYAYNDISKQKKSTPFPTLLQARSLNF